MPSSCSPRRPHVLASRLRQLGTASTLCALVFAGACTPDRAVAPSGAKPALTISDGGHAGNPHFFFLPPLAPVTTFTGIVDASFSPQVVVERGITRVADLKATLPAGGDAYSVDWKVTGLAVGATYRITISVNGGVVIGYTEVVAVTATSIKDAVTGAALPLAAGKLPIKFRVEIGAVPDGISEVCEVGPPGTHTFTYARDAEKAVKGKPVPVPIVSSPFTVESGNCVPFWKSGWHDVMTVAETNLAPDVLLDSITVTLVPSGGGSGVCGDPLEPTAYCPVRVTGTSSVKRELNPETGYRFTFYHRAKPQYSWYNACSLPNTQACASVELTLSPGTFGAGTPGTQFAVRFRNTQGAVGTIPWAAFNLWFYNLKADYPIGGSASPTHEAFFVGTAGVVGPDDPKWTNYCAGIGGCPNPGWNYGEWDWHVGDGLGDTGWGIDARPNPFAVVGCNAPPHSLAPNGYEAAGYYQTCGDGWIAFTFTVPGTWTFEESSFARLTGWTSDGTPTLCYLVLNEMSCQAEPPPSPPVPPTVPGGFTWQPVFMASSASPIQGLDGGNANDLWITCGYRCLYHYNGIPGSFLFRYPVPFGGNLYRSSSRNSGDAYFGGPDILRFEVLSIGNGVLTDIASHSGDLFGVSSYAAGVGFACGEGTMVRFRAGAPLEPIPTGLSTVPDSRDRFETAWTSSATDAYCAGRSGLYHYDGAAFSRVVTSPDLLSVRGTSAADVWVSGRRGVLQHFDGVNWSSVDAGQGDAQLGSVMPVSADEVFVAADNRLFEYTGGVWRTLPIPPGYRINDFAVYAPNSGHIFVGATRGPDGAQVVLIGVR